MRKDLESDEQQDLLQVHRAATAFNFHFQLMFCQGKTRMLLLLAGTGLHNYHQKQCRILWVRNVELEKPVAMVPLQCVDASSMRRR